VHGRSIALAHASGDLASALQRGLDRVLELFLERATEAQELIDPELALAQEITRRPRTRGERGEQMRTRRAFLLLLRELVRDPFHEREFGFEAGTGHHLCDLPAIVKTANFSRIWPAALTGLRTLAQRVKSGAARA